MADHFTDLLSEFLDDEDLSPGERARIANHLEGCAGCRATLDELRQVAARARILEDRAPDVDLWPGVASRIHARGSVVRPFAPVRQAARRISFTVPQLIAASVALMLLSGGAVWLARLGGPRTDFEPISAQDASPVPLPSAASGPIAPAAATAADATIADLERTLAEGRGRLAPETVQVIEHNLREIELAIEQCRTALAGDPASVYLNSHLADAQRRKLALLRRAAALVAERS